MEVKKIIDLPRKKVSESFAKIANPVSKTLGPHGEPIIIERKGQALDGSPLPPRITKDGVSVAMECSSEDKTEDLIIQTVKSMCKQTNKVAGDGTTGTIVLGKSIYDAANEYLENNEGHITPQNLRNQIEESSERINAQLTELSTPVSNNLEIIEKIATISANGDSEVGKIIAEAFEKVGAEGAITVDEGKSSKVELSVVDGYQFERGAEGRAIFFNNQSNTQYEADNAEIIIYDGKLVSYTDIIPLINMMLEKAKEESKPQPSIVIVANEFTNEFIQFMYIQKQQIGLSVCLVKGPNATNIRSCWYEDMAYYTGGTRLGNGNRNLMNCTLDDVGLVSKIVISKYLTTFYDGQGDEESLLNRVDQLIAERKVAESPYDVSILNDRLASLTNGIAKIEVGGFTELEIKEKYDRIEDALNASRAALSDGVIPGGGTALLRIAEGMKVSSAGDAILKKAITAPFYKILENSGLEMKTGDLEKVLKDQDSTFDFIQFRVGNAMDLGILDPVKVTKTALSNAVSISSLLITVGGGIIYDIK